MVRYRRNFVPGGTYFFTVTLADRTSSTLVDHMGALRTAFRIARHERRFTIDAIVILPEHLHAIWTLPSHLLLASTTSDNLMLVALLWGGGRAESFFSVCDCDFDAFVFYGRLPC